jgi:hypothetical protein
MEQHVGLRLYIDESESCLCDIGMISIIHEIDINIKIERTADNYHLYLKNCDTKQLLAKSIIPVTMEKTKDFENCCNSILDNIDKLHKSIKKCCHCGITYGFTTSNKRNKYMNVGFSDVCCDCGLQRIYNAKYSDQVCSICQDPVGFGESESSVCDDHRHKIHSHCRSRLVKDSCPICRVNSDTRTNPDEDSIRGLSYRSSTETEYDSDEDYDPEVDIDIELEEGEITSHNVLYRTVIGGNVYVGRVREEHDETDLNQGLQM